MPLQGTNSYHKFQNQHSNDDYRLRISKLTWYYEFTVIIGYIMNLVVFIVPFNVYCVIRITYMYVYKLNMRDNIWFISWWHCILIINTYLFNYIVQCKYLKTFEVSVHPEVNCSQVKYE